MKVKVINASSKKTRYELRKALAELIQEKKVESCGFLIGRL